MLTYLAISLIFIGIAAGPLYGYFLSRNQKILNISLLVLLFILGLGLAFYIFFSTGTFFVSGITCLLIPAASISLLLLLFWRQKQQERLANDQLLHRWYWLGVILIPLILALPFFELFWIRMVCFDLNQRSAKPIIAALEEYKNSQGTYPEDIDDLVPEYLASIPNGNCAPLSSSTFEEPAFEITTCKPENITILTIPIGSGEWIQRYNLDARVWARISFLDGACSYLE